MPIGCFISIKLMLIILMTGLSSCCCYTRSRGGFDLATSLGVLFDHGFMPAIQASDKQGLGLINITTITH